LTITPEHGYLMRSRRQANIFFLSYEFEFIDYAQITFLSTSLVLSLLRRLFIIYEFVRAFTWGVPRLVLYWNLGSIGVFYLPFIELRGTVLWFWYEVKIGVLRSLSLG